MLHFTIDSRSGYSIAHVAKAIMVIGKNPIGREKLMKKLSLNEASARTLLKRLEKSGYVAATAKGHGLTEKGKCLFARISRNIIGPKSISADGVAVSRHNVAYLVKNKEKKIRFGVEQRDEAIRLGADGLITLIYSNGLVMPGIKWRVSNSISKLFDFNNGDVLLIGSAKTENIAELAALNSALRLFLSF